MQVLHGLWPQEDFTVKKRSFACMIVVVAGLGSSVTSQQATTGVPDPYLQIAIESGVCGDAAVVSVFYNAADNTLSATCEEDVQGFVPLLGGLVIPVAAGIASVLAATAGGGGPADTISR
jgi:hypothetical protein